MYIVILTLTCSCEYLKVSIYSNLIILHPMAHSSVYSV